MFRYYIYQGTAIQFSMQIINKYTKSYKTHIHEEYTKWTQPYKLLQCKKLIKSTRFVETKVGTLTRTQPKREHKKEDFIMLKYLSKKKKKKILECEMF
jgi:hypothetical protein